jgi:hypothetical protein
VYREATAPDRELTLRGTPGRRRRERRAAPGARRVEWGGAGSRADELAAPAILVSETANGLVTAVRFAELELEDALASLDDALALPIELVPDTELAAEAWRWRRVAASPPTPPPTSPWPSASRRRF